MQNKKVENVKAVFIAIPESAVVDSGISEGELLQITATKGKIVIEAVDDKSDIVCDGDCEHCPINEIECDGDCENCPCRSQCD